MAWPPEPGRWPPGSWKCGEDAGELPLPDSVMLRFWDGPMSDTTDPGPVRGDLPSHSGRLGFKNYVVGFKVKG